MILVYKYLRIILLLFFLFILYTYETPSIGHFIIVFIVSIALTVFSKKLFKEKKFKEFTLLQKTLFISSIGCLLITVIYYTYKG
jgi:hypothetical protein